MIRVRAEYSRNGIVFEEQAMRKDKRLVLLAAVVCGAAVAACDGGQQQGQVWVRGD
ncbi:MAG: hypothetical protein IH624_12695 [Phycisphaerae bacterium]|nr:hypothetical protein [Phycisphaerae bacterium]